jgi:hypothetical protein
MAGWLARYVSWKGAFGITLAFLLLAAYVVVPIWKHTTEGEIVEVGGIVLAPLDVPDYSADLYYMRVRLDSGREVRVRVSRGLMVIPGRAVVLSARRTDNDRLSAFRFLRYLPSDT